jgi:hypothetical protein
MGSLAPFCFSMNRIAHQTRVDVSMRSRLLISLHFTFRLKSRTVNTLKNSIVRTHDVGALSWQAPETAVDGRTMHPRRTDPHHGN